MNEEHLKGMVRTLGPVLQDKAKAEQLLKGYWRHRKALVWTVQDVHQAANEEELVLTNQEAERVLKHVHLHHNKQYGVRWENLGALIHDWVLERKMTKAELRTFVNKNEMTVDSKKRRAQ